MDGRTIEWISYANARVLLGGVTYKAFVRLLADGRLSVRRVPGGHPKVDRAEVLSLAPQLVESRLQTA